MLARELLAVLSTCYRFVQVGPEDLGREVWPAVRQELRCLVALSVHLPVRLEHPWAAEVFMTDASWVGQGVVCLLYTSDAADDM
eukprot:11753404-Alexandrium_andersonii.AAC.1